MARTGNRIVATNQLQDYLKTIKADALKTVFNARADRGTTSELRKLCKNGADLNYLENERGFSCIPAVFSSINQIRFFIKTGRDVNSRDENGDTALHIAIRKINWGMKFNPKVDRNVIKFLLEHSADPNSTNLSGETPLFILTSTNSEYNRPVVEMLLEKGANLESRDNDGVSLLHRENLYGSGDFTFAGWLMEKIERDYNVDQRTSSWLYSKTPLMVAAKENAYELCKMLIERGADVNAKDRQGYTALHHHFVEYGYCTEQTPLSKLLIDTGTDPNVRSTSGKDAYLIALLRYPNKRGEEEFTGGAQPTKQVEIFELAGARDIMRMNMAKPDLINLENWDEVMTKSVNFGLQPSAEFLVGYNLVRANPIRNEQNYAIAMDTVSRIFAEDEKLKLWTLLGFTQSSDPSLVFETINYLSEELQRYGDFASLEEIDLNTLLNLTKSLKTWLDTVVVNGQESTVTAQHISQIQSVVSLTIACFEKRIRETNSKIIGNYIMDLYVTAINVLVILRSRFVDNELLLRTLLNLDLRDRNGNTLLHLTVGFWFDYLSYYGSISIIDIALEIIEFVDVAAKNRFGLEPAQTIKWKDKPLWMGFWSESKEMKEKLLTLLRKMAEKGAHFDARNHEWNNEPTLKEILEEDGGLNSTFPYDNLQCMCARVIARSLVPFRNGEVPELVEKFILLHV